MKDKFCPKCGGTGKLPRYPNPPCVLPVNVIHGIKVNAPDCDRCNGTGRVDIKEE